MAAIFALGMLLAAGAAAMGHIVPVGVGIQQYLKVQPKKVFLEYNLGFSAFAGYAEVLKMETGRDNILQREEIEAWLDAQQPRLLANLAISLDGRPLEFRLLKRETYALFPNIDVTKVPGVEFDTWWHFEADVDIGPGEHRFDMFDRNYEREESQSIVWFPKDPPGFLEYAFEGNPKTARAMDMGANWQMLARGATLYVEFKKEAFAAAATPSTSTSESATMTASTSDAMRTAAVEAARKQGVEYRGAEENEETKNLIGLRDTAWYLAIGLALAWGAAHALAPGHGKSMVAAYLLGTQGRIRDAVALGGIVTFTHTASIFLLAVVIFWVADRLGMNPNTAAGKAQVALEVGAGALVFLMGVGILFRRLRGLEEWGHSHGPGGHHHHRHGHGPPGHVHEHGDEHEHEHGSEREPRAGHAHAPPPGPGGGGLLALGLAAGAQPCTAGIALVFMSVAQAWLWKGLYLLVAFSFGLGLVIVSIAVAMVLAKSILAERVEKEGLLLRALPVLSALALTAVGAWMVIDCLVRNKVGPFAHT